MKTAFDAIKLGENEKVKVWDVLLTPEGIKLPFQLQLEEDDKDYIPREFWPYIGRIRILAVLEKKPEELKNITFSIAFCAPSDLMRYRRDRANAICVGRWNKAFEEIMDSASENWPNNKIAHTGIIPELESLKRDEVVCAALSHVNGHLPQWLHTCEFYNEPLNSRLFKEYVGE